MSETKKLRTFFYHDIGQDTNGNFGPSARDTGWLAVVGFTMEEAVTLLPKKAQRKIAKEMKRAKDEDFEDGLEEWCAQTCTWGWDFSIMDQDNWDAFLENEEWEPDAN
jgi:hypothetical protein